MNKLELTKSAVSLVVGAGVSSIITGVVKNSTDPENQAQKVLIFAGKTGITMLVSDAVKDHVGAKIDTAAEWASKWYNTLK